MSEHTSPFGEYETSDNAGRIDFSRVHAWLSESYWCEGISAERMKHGFDHSSIVAGTYHPNHGQVAVGRVITDYTRFAYLMDVIVEPELRGQGIGKATVQFLLDHPRMTDIDVWMLATRDAHGLYESFGFETEPHPERWMTIRR